MSQEQPVSAAKCCRRCGYPVLLVLASQDSGTPVPAYHDARGAKSRVGRADPHAKVRPRLGREVAENAPGPCFGTKGRVSWHENAYSVESIGVLWRRQTCWTIGYSASNGPVVQEIRPFAHVCTP